MQITLSFDTFTELPYTSGTIQNISSQATVEICQEDTVNTGLILGPGEWFSWSNSTVYARSAWDYEPTATCAVVPFKKGGEGGGSEYILPVATNNTLGGVKSSDEAGAIKVDSSGKMTYNAPSSTPLSAPDWKTNTAYPENALVECNDNIYVCLAAHTSGTFADDLANGKWKLVSMTLTAATSSALGGVKSNSADGGVTVDSDGKMTINLPIATSSKLGGVKSSSLPGKISVNSTTGVMTYNPPNTELSLGEVGYVSWQYSLITNHLPLDGSTINDFGTDYPELLAFFTDNNLVTSVQADYDANKALLLYDSGTDMATMPNFLDKTVWGGNTIEEKEAGLPNIEGQFALGDNINAFSGLMGRWASSGVFEVVQASTDDYVVGRGSRTTPYRGGIKFDASRSSPIYGNSTTVQPPAITLIPQIRYQRDVIINDGNATGTIISYLGLTAPLGYLICDGTVYNIADYQALAEHINTQFGSYSYFGGDGITTFSVPDLRGEFLRGTGTNSHVSALGEGINEGSGASVGTHQGATSVYKMDGGGNVVYVHNTTAYKNIANPDAVFLSNRTGTISASHYQQDGSIMYMTTRPTNTSVLYCIKC